MKQGHTFCHVSSSRENAAFGTAAIVAASLLLSVFAWDTALAQTRPTPTDPTVGLRVGPPAGVDPRLQAPIGHRQPRPTDLPPNVRREEASPTTNGDRELDEKLRICRGC
jgi:hypothetical protein